MRGRLAVSCTLGRAGELIDVSESRMVRLERRGIAERLPPARTYETRTVEPEVSVVEPGPVAKPAPVRRRRKKVTVKGDA